MKLKETQEENDAIRAIIMEGIIIILLLLLLIPELMANHACEVCRCECKCKIFLCAYAALQSSGNSSSMHSACAQ